MDWSLSDQAELLLLWLHRRNAPASFDEIDSLPWLQDGLGSAALSQLWGHGFIGDGNQVEITEEGRQFCNAPRLRAPHYKAKLALRLLRALVENRVHCVLVGGTTPVRRQTILYAFTDRHLDGTLYTMRVDDPRKHLVSNPLVVIEGLSADPRWNQPPLDPRGAIFVIEGADKQQVVSWVATRLGEPFEVIDLG